jgi:hypothetical protein
MRFVGARVFPLLGLLALGLLAACQDPSGVGLGLIDEEGGDPSLVLLLPEDLTLGDREDVTGGYADGTLPTQERILVGAVMDPDFGDVEAHAYLDVRPPTVVPSGFTERTITSATLRLARDYVYGDSTATLALALYEITADEWNPVGAGADTTFAVGDLLDTYDVSASDTLSTLRLPEAWVDANDELLRSDSALAAINGFQLRLDDGAAGGAVVGFDALRSTLRLTTSEDTVDYPLREVFTHVERGDAPPPSDDVLVLREGAGEALRFTLPFDSLSDVAVARASFRLTVDPDLLDAGTLARALPPELVLLGVTDADVRLSLATAEFDASSDTYSFTSGSLASAVQDAVLGSSIFEHYEIEPVRNPATVGVLPVVVGPAPGTGEDERRPRLVLTVVPASN